MARGGAITAQAKYTQAKITAVILGHNCLPFMPVNQGAVFPCKPKLNTELHPIAFSE